jgi:hypothetical protein
MKVDEKYIRQAEVAAGEGLTNRQLARLFGISTRTLQKWIREDERFAHALKEGKAIADARVARSLYERATGYSHPEEKVFCSDGAIVTYNTTKHYPPDTAAQTFWLKNRRPHEWRDRIEHTGRDGERLAAVNALMVQTDPKEAVKVYLDLMSGSAPALPAPAKVTDVEDLNDDLADEFL